MLLIGILTIALVAAPVIAQEEAQYAPEEPASYEVAQGTIIDISPAHDSIRVEETDGSLTDFEVPPETPIHYAAGDAPLLAPTRDNLEVGQEVEVGLYLPEFEILIYPPQRIADQITIFA